MRIINSTAMSDTQATLGSIRQLVRRLSFFTSIPKHPCYNAGTMKHPSTFMYYDRLWRKWRNCTLEYLLAENDAELDICTVDENGTAGEPIKWAAWLKQNAASVQPLSAKYQTEQTEPEKGDFSNKAIVLLLREMKQDQEQTNKLARTFFMLYIICFCLGILGLLLSKLFGE